MLVRPSLQLNNRDQAGKRRPYDWKRSVNSLNQPGLFQNIWIWGTNKGSKAVEIDDWKGVTLSLNCNFYGSVVYTRNAGSLQIFRGRKLSDPDSFASFLCTVIKNRWLITTKVQVDWS